MEDQKQIKASYMFCLQFQSRVQSLLGYINIENMELTFVPAEQCFVCS